MFCALYFTWNGTTQRAIKKVRGITKADKASLIEPENPAVDFIFNEDKDD